MAVALAWDLLGRDSASPAFLRVAASADKAAAATARSTAALAESNGVATRFAAGMSAAGAKLTKGLTLPLLGLAAVSVDQAAKFQKSMTLIQTAGGETAAKTAVISKGIMGIATSTGTSLKDLGDGIYTVAKAGGTKWSATDQLKILKAAAQGAKAENVDMATSVNALTSVMASYGYNASQAVSTQNMLIRGAGLAKTTMQDFAGSLANVVPLASSLHISFAQVAGAIATMTQHGETAQRSTENLSNLITALAGQNNVASSAMQQLNINTLDLQQNLGKRGLVGTLNIVEDALAKHSKGGMVVVSAFKQAALATHSLDTMMGTFQGTLKTNSEGLLKGGMSIKQYTAYAKSLGGTAGASALQFLGLYKSSQGFSDQLKSGNGTIRTSATMLQKMLGGVTGMRVALMLGGASAAQFAANTKAVGDAAQHAGVDVLGWNKTSETLSVKMDKAKAALQVLAVEIGTALIPAVSKIVSGVSSAVRWFSGLSSTSKQVLGWSVLVIAAIGPVLAILGRLVLVGRLVGLTFLKLGGAAAGVTRFAKGLMLMNVALATTEKRSYGAGASTRVFLNQFGLGIGILTAFAAAVGFGGKKLSDWLEKGDSSVYMLNRLGKASQGFTAALKASNGAITENVRTSVGKQLQDAGIADKAHKAGISVNMLTDAVIGGRPAMNDLIATWRASGKPADQTIQAFNAVWASYDAGTVKAAQLAAKQRELATVNLKTATGTASLRKGLQNTYAEQVPAAARATSKLAKSVNDYRTNAITTVGVTNRLGSAISAVALKGQALADALNNIDGGSIGTAEAFIAFKQAAHGLGAQFDKNNKSIVGNSDAALQNRGALLSAIDAAKAHAAAMTAQGDKAKTVAAALKGDIKSLEDQAVAAGGSKKQIDRLLQSLGLMPKQVDTALHVTGADLAAQAIKNVQDAIDRLHSKTITFSAIMSYEKAVGINPTTTRSQSGSGDRKAHNATGGTIFGPGTGTSDSVPIWASNGEEIINAKQSKKHRSLLKAINAGIQGFASGGTVSKPDQGTLSSAAASAIGYIGTAYAPKFDVAAVGIGRIRDQIRHAWEVLNHEVSLGLSSAAAAAFRKELRGYKELAARELKALKTQIAGTDARGLLTSLKSDAATDIATAYSKLLTDARHAGLGKFAPGALSNKAKTDLAAGGFTKTQIGKMTDSESALLAVQARRTRVVEALTKAQQKYADAVAQWKDLKSSVASAISGTFDITAAGASAQVYGDQAAAPTTAGSILGALRAAVKKAQSFGRVLKTLAKDGLNPNLIAQLAQAGPAALDQAKALAAATPKQIGQINSQYGALVGKKGVANTIGTQIANGLYGAGVQSAKGLVAGLKSQQTALNKAITAIADGMLRQLKRKLKIHSPSQVMRWHGQMTGEGFRLGMLDKADAIASAADGYGNAAVPGSQYAAAAPRGGDTHYHQWNIEGVTDPEAVAAAAVRRIQFAGRF